MQRGEAQAPGDTEKGADAPEDGDDAKESAKVVEMKFADPRDEAEKSELQTSQRKCQLDHSHSSASRCLIYRLLVKPTSHFLTYFPSNR